MPTALLLTHAYFVETEAGMTNVILSFSLCAFNLTADLLRHTPFDERSRAQHQDMLSASYPEFFAGWIRPKLRLGVKENSVIFIVKVSS